MCKNNTNACKESTREVIGDGEETVADCCPWLQQLTSSGAPTAATGAGAQVGCEPRGKMVPGPMSRAHECPVCPSSTEQCRLLF